MRLIKTLLPDLEAEVWSYLTPEEKYVIGKFFGEKAPPIADWVIAAKQFLCSGWLSGLLWLRVHAEAFISYKTVLKNAIRDCSSIPEDTLSAVRYWISDTTRLNAVIYSLFHKNIKAYGVVVAWETQRAIRKYILEAGWALFDDTLTRLVIASDEDAEGVTALFNAIKALTNSKYTDRIMELAAERNSPAAACWAKENGAAVSSAHMRTAIEKSHAAVAEKFISWEDKINHIVYSAHSVCSRIAKIKRKIASAEYQASESAYASDLADISLLITIREKLATRYYEISRQKAPKSFYDERLY
jgi:hypothetical protein